MAPWCHKENYLELSESVSIYHILYIVSFCRFVFLRLISTATLPICPFHDYCSQRVTGTFTSWRITWCSFEFRYYYLVRSPPIWRTRTCSGPHMYLLPTEDLECARFSLIVIYQVNGDLASYLWRVFWRNVLLTRCTCHCSLMFTNVHISAPRAITWNFELGLANNDAGDKVKSTPEF